MTKGLSKGILATVAGLTMAGAAAEAEENWSMATSWGGGPILERAAKGFAQKAEFLTGGEVKIQVFPGGTMGSPLKVSDTVKNGVTEAGHQWAGYDWGVDKTGVLFGNFAGGLSGELMLHWMYNGGGLQMYRDWRMEKFNVVSMPCGLMPREGGLFSNKKVQTLDDFKGLKLRTSGAWAEISSEMGASTVILPGAEVYPALERGVIDAVEWAQLSINKSLGFHKIAKYIILPGIHQPSAILECQFNTKAWDRLSDRNKALLEMAAKTTTTEFYTELGHNDTEAYEFYVKSGNEIVVLDDEVIKTAETASLAWADNVAKDNAWFAKVWESQKAYREAWSNAPKYR